MQSDGKLWQQSYKGDTNYQPSIIEWRVETHNAIVSLNLFHSHGKLRGARTFDFDTRGLFSLAWEFLRNGAMSIFYVHVGC